MLFLELYPPNPDKDNLVQVLWYLALKHELMLRDLILTVIYLNMLLHKISIYSQFRIEIDISLSYFTVVFWKPCFTLFMLILKHL